MPIYVFSCPKCNDRFEKMTSFSAIEDIVCPECGSKVNRVYDGVSVYGGISNKEKECPVNCPCCTCGKNA